MRGRKGMKKKPAKKKSAGAKNVKLKGKQNSLPPALKAKILKAKKKKK